MMQRLKTKNSIDNEINESQNQKIKVDVTCTLNAMVGCEFSKAKNLQLNEKNLKGNSEKRLRKRNCQDLRHARLQTCFTYSKYFSLTENLVSQSLCKKITSHNSSSYISETCPGVSKITSDCSSRGSRRWSCCSRHTKVNDNTWCPRTDTSRNITPFESPSTSDCSKPTTCIVERPSSRVSMPAPSHTAARRLMSCKCLSNTPEANTQFTRAAATRLYKWWHQLFVSLLWQLTASTAISMLFTLCWIMAHSLVVVVAHTVEELPVMAAGALAPTESLLSFPTVSITTTTTATVTRILSPLSEETLAKGTSLSPALTQQQQMPTKSRRYNRGKYIKSNNKYDIKHYSHNNTTPTTTNISLGSVSASIIVTSVIDKFPANTTEITFLNNISPTRHYMRLSSSALPLPLNSTTASGYNYDISGTQSPTTSLGIDSAILSLNHGYALNDSIMEYGTNNGSSGGHEDGGGGGNKKNSIDSGLAFDDLSSEDASEYVFDRTDVRIIFITLYTLVFCCCFFGNLLVILVVTLSRRLRSITNFFLANLALADFCVGLFCVMQNLSIYLIDSWVFGEFLCRMYQFVHSLSYTASIFILVVICMERYFAIVHPITCKQILTAARLRMVMLTVWITSAVYSTPKFIFSKTIKNVHTESGQEEEICVLDRKMFNSKLLDMINFVLLYVIPLLVMTVLYSKIAIALWRSSRGLTHHLAQQRDNNSMGMHNSMYHHHHHHHPNNQLHNNHHHLHHHSQQNATAVGAGSTIPLAGSNCSMGSVTSLSRKQSSKYEKRGSINVAESQVSMDADRPVVSACRKASFYQHNHLTHHHAQQMGKSATANHRTLLHQTQSGSGSGNGGAGGGSGAASCAPLHGSQRVSHYSHSSNNVLRARRGVVRMLIIFVLTFALCNLPYHARKMWQYWSRSYRGDSNFNALFTPLTFLVTYFNSGINPLLYAFLSRNFRKGMRELLMCSWRKSKTKSSTNSSMHHKRMTLQNHSLPTDTTHIGNEQL